VVTGGRRREEGAIVEVFHHADAAYTEWRATHPDGYVVNVRPDGPLLLHRATCRHLRQTGLGKGRSPTSLPKACGTERGELEDWARSGGRMPLPCTNCMRRA
jgi:hypothetical protein